ncbi:hypothetical protein F4V57_01520 [Acinetobacter qingfengensis]|uniref:Uncharacterized protein n=1 Tax=Acinetobacter qingfengensis TaxID=1262585 RepID=A0A1E7R918_9GAMM|nr:hypothetical protein [Acinetobacter qingfengensis]KAA8735505.1 hypothetical protein F4V57_01520 [Acinetobacter qingfengensis]OEY95849.1 hypothetical protein BJI46_02725 [Acinetobacter qingfengensis]
MSILQRFILSNQQHNRHLNQVHCVENDYAGKSCEQLFQILLTTQDQDLISGLKRLLLSRGYTRKELQQILTPQIRIKGC